MYKWHKDNVPHPKRSQHDKDNKEWYIKRNKQLIADRQTNTFRKLVEMYGLSQPRLQQLVEKQEVINSEGI